MKKNFLIIALIPIMSFSQLNKTACTTLGKINAIIQEGHYRPKAVDDSLSVFVFKTFLSQLDDDNRLFLEPEISELKKHQYKIDDYINQGDCRFLNDIQEAYTKAIKRYNSIIGGIKSERFQYSSDQKIIFSKKAFPYAKDVDELKNIYKKKILFDVLRDVSEISENKDSLSVNFDQIASLSKIKILDSYSCKSSELSLSNDEFLDKFYNVFCSYFDPHTEYLSKTERSNFLSSVSASNLTFGLFLSLNDNDEITVDEIIPESSAYNSKKIDKGDKIIRIRIKGESYTINCASMSKIGEIISSNDYKSADFTFRKNSGEIYTVKLTKKVMKDYNNKIYSYIIKKEDNNIGYIKIPSFYAKFDNGQTDVSEDLIREMMKLKHDNIRGLIIDLENNGGGSMQEAMKMVSTFINKGPIAIMNDQMGVNEVVNDPYMGTIYEGPVTILINAFSASASEFFTNAMQDYKRAIVIGNQSFGKATMQRIYPLNNRRNSNEFVKLTIEKFYRITGKSNQTIGITPDITMPTLFDKQMPRESDFDTALKNDTITIEANFVEQENDHYLQAIVNSKKRISENELVKQENDLNAKINSLYDNLEPIVLNFEAVFDNVAKVNKVWKEVEKISKTENEIEVVQNSTDKELEKNDMYLQNNAIDRIKAIKSNLHIVEAASIIKDLN